MTKRLVNEPRMAVKKKGALCPPFLADVYLITYGHPPEGPEIVPFVLLNVHDTPEQLVCVAVSKKVLLPTADVTATPLVALNPGTVGLAPPTHAVAELL